MKIIYNIFFYSIYYLLNILSPLLKIRLLQIETYNIGHMSQPIEIHLNEKKLNLINNNLLDIYFPNKEISNSYLWKKWREILQIKIPDKILRFFFEPIFIIALKKNNKKMLIPFRHHRKNLNYNVTNRNNATDKTWQSNDINNVLDKTDPLINFTKKEIESGYKFLKKNNILINDKIILLISRDPKYWHDNSSKKVSSEYTCRDQDINIFKDAVEHLCSQNYKIIRMGKNMEKKLDINNSNFFDYAFSSERSDFLDIFLFKVCYFVISTGSGLDNVSSLFRKNIIHINYGDLVMMNYLNNNIKLFFPKNFYYIKNNIKLNILEIQKILLEHSNIIDCQELLKKTHIGYKNIDNTHIKDACIEMVNYCKNGLDDETIILNKNLKDQIKNKYNMKFKTNFCKTYFKSINL